MSDKVSSWIEVLRKVPDNSIWETTSYSGILDLKYLKEKGIQYSKKMNSEEIFFKLTPSSKIILISYLQRLDYMPTEENHIHYKNKKIVESYDNLDAGLLISKDIPIDEGQISKSIYTEWF